MTIGTYARRWQRSLVRVLAEERWQPWLQYGGIFLLGLCLSAASLGNLPQPIAMAVLCAGLPG